MCGDPVRALPALPVLGPDVHGRNLRAVLFAPVACLSGAVLRGAENRVGGGRDLGGLARRSPRVYTPPRLPPCWADFCFSRKFTPHGSPAPWPSGLARFCSRSS